MCRIWSKSRRWIGTITDILKVSLHYYRLAVNVANWLVTLVHSLMLRKHDFLRKLRVLYVVIKSFTEILRTPVPLQEHHFQFRHSHNWLQGKNSALVSRFLSHRTFLELFWPQGRCCVFRSVARSGDEWLYRHWLGRQSPFCYLAGSTTATEAAA